MRVLTTDVFCGSFLFTRGGRLVEVLVDRTSARASGTFVLDGPDDLLAAQETYSRGEAVANVKEIREGVTLLRERLAYHLRRRA
jgi:hypothetical protein